MNLLEELNRKFPIGSHIGRRVVISPWRRVPREGSSGHDIVAVLRCDCGDEHEVDYMQVGEMCKTCHRKRKFNPMLHAMSRDALQVEDAKKNARARVAAEASAKLAALPRPLSPPRRP
jgi:hypothetical protein